MKPTAVRANKTEINSTTVNNTSSSVPIGKTVCSTPNKNQSSLNASPATANSTQQSVSSGAPTIPSTSSTTSITSLNSSSSGGGSVGGVATSQIQSSIATRDENHSHANKTTISTRDQQQPLQNNSIIPTTAPVAFAAVAKHSSSQHTANEGKWTAHNHILFIIFYLLCLHECPTTKNKFEQTQNERTNKTQYFNRCFFNFFLCLTHSKLNLANKKDNFIRHLHRQRFQRLPVIQIRLPRIKHPL